VIFSKADKDNSRMLDLKEFQNVVDDIIERYPQVEIYLKKNQMKDMATLLNKSLENPATTVDIEYFKQAVSEVDSQMKNLPATAQVHVPYTYIYAYFLLKILWVILYICLVVGSKFESF
jgi:NADH:ubiquinone reductase (non-electrogenic)